MSVVRVENVSKSYALGEQTVVALKDITLAIEDGVFLAIAGPSGSGKSTLLNLIGCIDTPTTGKVYVGGQDVSGRPPISWPIYVPVLSGSFSKPSIFCQCYRRRRTSSTRYCNSAK